MKRRFSKRRGSAGRARRKFTKKFKQASSAFRKWRNRIAGDRF